MKPHLTRISLTIIALVLFFQSSNGNISLPEIFSDNMVLQQKSDVMIWGWAKTGEKIVLKADWLDTEITTTVDNQGKWNLILKTPSAGGPYNIHLKGYNELTLKNVLIGEVWLCSGQSNMEWSAAMGINNAEEEIKNANYPDIRFFSVYHATSIYPQDHFTGEWTACTSESMRNFSVIAYLYAKKLHEVLGVPVGVINSSWGGTPAEAWMPEEVIEKDDFLRQAATFQKPVPWGPVESGRIYNSMISPLVHFRIAGVLWYQGEANTVNAYAYKEILTALIKSWRTGWGYEFPFYYAQIAPYKYGKRYEGAEVREAQRKVLAVPNTGMVVLSDIGDTSNIHPKNKQDAALRFANLALNRYYKVIKTEDSGPLYKEMTIDRNKAIISFDHAEGLYVKGKNPDWFEVAGEDKVFYPATAKIKDNQVIVQSDHVKVPMVVRFAWSNTATPNLFNSANLPASCFKTE
jgi:sialate O-acetylesterase